MRGISFEYSSPVSPCGANRMDVACFIGFVSWNREKFISDALKKWWKACELNISPGEPDPVNRPIEPWDTFQSLFKWWKAHEWRNISSDKLNLVDRPVPVESWDAFQELFDVRRLTHQDDDNYLDNYLAAAVRAFFRQGGRKCYIIPMGAPLPYLASEADKFKKIMHLFPVSGFSKNTILKIEDLTDFPLGTLIDNVIDNVIDDAQDMEKGRGLTHLTDLADVSYVCFPDLVELFTSDIKEMEKRTEQAKEEIFVKCSQKETVDPWFYIQPYQAPVLSRKRYMIWKRFIDLGLMFLKTRASNTQLVASLPLPDKTAQKDFETFVLTELLETSAEKDVLYRRLQLAFPWLKTDQSDKLPESAEPPEGTLMGLLARGTILKGAYKSIAGFPVESANDLMPPDIDGFTRMEDTGLSFSERISLISFMPGGIELQSDVTAVNTPEYRHAVIRRIMILVCRTAHVAGLNYVFENSGPNTWHLMEDALSDLLMKIYQQNGLWGATSDKAFSVVCNRETMTRNDIDNGRLIVNITLQPAVPVEHITVNMIVEKGGIISTT